MRDPESFRRDPGRVAVFSPFGLGILDLALAHWVKHQAQEFGIGTSVDDFLPLPLADAVA
ncbi:hypothetical protein QBA75_39140 [Streptomyces stelliscabiei]